MTATLASLPQSAPASWVKFLSENGDRLTWGSTDWDLVRKGGPDLLLRYHQAVYRYFHLKIRDPNVADELYSDFAFKLLESEKVFSNANPGRVRFRYYLMRVLKNMVFDYYRKKSRCQTVPLPADLADGRAQEPDSQEDEDFNPIFRQVLLDQAWKALEENDQKTGHYYYRVLRCKEKHPDFTSTQLARELSREGGQAFNADSVRQALKRARAKFRQLVREEVEQSLYKPTPEELEEELIALKLLPYCQETLE
jgi:RNA polymerase sigma-70 factor (ECF subfamily)